MKSLIQSMLRPLGLRLTRLESVAQPDYGLSVLFSTLKRFGFSPRHILDVGANHGNWTRTAITYFPDAEYTLLEPQDHLKVHIQDLIGAGHQIRWINAGASDRSETLPFHVSPRDDSSTFATPHGDRAPVATTPVQVTSRNDLVELHNLQIPELVKIDAEGFDLRILLGAGELLGKTDVFLLEATVGCPYENSVLKIMNFMSDHDYRLIDLTDMNRSPKHGVLWLTELAFLRRSSPLLDGASSYE
jgi:FkbM family methyltransferase